MDNLQMMAERIKNLCDVKGVSINKMLTESGVGARTYHNILAGSYPSSDKVFKIAEYFNVSVDYLLGRADSPQKTTSAIDEYLARIEAKEPNQAIIMHRNEKGGQEVIQLSEERLQRILKIIDLMDNEDKKQ